MAISMYDFFYPCIDPRVDEFVPLLLGQRARRTRGEKSTPSCLRSSRLLSRHASFCAPSAKIGVRTRQRGRRGRLAGIEVPKHEDKEVTVRDLKARICQTVDF